ncbi:CLUMA_CG000882, isoform A [Clunio marinus]|uniref:CLUMA_CG000882, isoform A n=1 Tax=Clunio marinus TaxID=568069 RepID=A0A1J1HGA3_9DIPT|nr:CLUMA_CG000882, isoform A [Clunio marinus]
MIETKIEQPREEKTCEQKRSYTDTLKSKERFLIVKPKDDEIDRTKTKEKIRLLTPKNLILLVLSNASTNGIRITTVSQDDKLESTLKNQLGPNFDIMSQEKKKPKLKIIFYDTMDEYPSEAELKDGLYSQNIDLFDANDELKLIKKNHGSKKNLKLAKRFNLKQIVDKPTRETKDTSTLIDWIFTSRTNSSCEVFDNINIADHNFIKFYFNKIEKSENSYKKIIIKDSSEYSGEKLKEKVKKSIWIPDEFNEEMNVKFNYNNNENATKDLSEYPEKVVSELILYKPIKISTSYKWYNKSLKLMKEDKIFAKNTYLNDKNETNWKKYLFRQQSCHYQNIQFDTVMHLELDDF